MIHKYRENKSVIRNCFSSVSDQNDQWKRIILLIWPINSLNSKKEESCICEWWHFYALLSLFKYSFFKKGPFLVINRCRYMWKVIHGNLKKWTQFLPICCFVFRRYRFLECLILEIGCVYAYQTIIVAEICVYLLCNL